MVLYPARPATLILGNVLPPGVLALAKLECGH